MEQIEELLIAYFLQNNAKLPRNKSIEDAVTLFIEGARQAGWNHTTAARFTNQFKDKTYDCSRHFIWVLASKGLKYCNKCDTVHQKEDFHKHSGQKDGLQTMCRFCWQKDQKDNPEKWAQRTALRRARKLNATPSWVSLESLKEIYKNIPEGMHVDHIVPLTHETVCGLHVPWNLQYLSATDNHKKSNKMDFRAEEERLLLLNN